MCSVYSDWEYSHTNFKSLGSQSVVKDSQLSCSLQADWVAGG
jgi:hypothetical protein